MVSPTALGARQAVYFWTAGRLLVGTLLVAGALPGRREEPRGELRRFALIAGASIALLAATEALLWAFRDGLPALARVLAVGEITGVLPGLTPAVVVLGAVGAGLYLLAALAHLRGGPGHWRDLAVAAPRAGAGGGEPRALHTIEETVTAGSSSLNYDAAADQYIYVWKTDKNWAGTCRQLQVKLADGMQYVANFKFTK